MPSRVSDDDFEVNRPYVQQKQYLDLSAAKELPESHAWTTAADGDVVGGGAEESIPVVDLGSRGAAEQIGRACKTWGAFQVINHGISGELLWRVESAGKRLFSLPLHQKLRAARSPNGVSGYGVARISSFFPKLMWSEGFTIVGSPLEHSRLLWPQDFNSFCEVVEEYEKEMKKLAGRMMKLILESLGVAEEDAKWGVESKGRCSALQLNSYPACPDPGRAMGLAEHTDSTVLTILHQNNTSGLQVFREGAAGGWVTVPPIPGALVINAGDLLHILSNGLYHSVLHRAVVNRSSHRLSVAYLYGPPPGIKISPLPKLVAEGQPPLFRAITWSEYLRTKAKHFDKALSSVRLICAPRNPFSDTNDHNRVRVG
ncbi:PREDICTED: gibberellin 3-beta-dioxygenase 1-like [Ipomoea nil]|uniref:gibberellin 3-beta-dioxygenase 1-like n=1 Tax=Ipomoea nil TaxID=35883 RepID=UPI000901DE15|nr:PREDICTED: gibberellin 3-beta-dioxygenase 1-like [Ipomoea nil]